MCDHLNTNTLTQVNRLTNATTGETFFTVCVKVHCTDCGTAFRFLGDHRGVPESVEEAMSHRLAGWTSNTGDEWGCLIAPFSVGELSEMPVMGRA